jgi:RNA polymerase sigma-70 factor (ECF subfamily)
MLKAGSKVDDVQFSRRWRPALMSFFLRRIHNYAESEDLTQEVFTRLLSTDIALAQAPDAYVFQVAANLLADRGRRLKVRAEYREIALQLDGHGVEPLDPHHILAGRMAMATFASGLEALPERTRVFFTLYRVESMSLDAIAESYGISKSAVKKHVTKAMAHLMARMRHAR